MRSQRSGSWFWWWKLLALHVMPTLCSYLPTANLEAIKAVEKSKGGTWVETLGELSGVHSLSTSISCGKVGREERWRYFQKPRGGW